jgi:formiminotetrahydrofolate cyclodeaminase
VTEAAAGLPELRLTELLDALAGDQVVASGSAAALTSAMAAEIVAMVARATTGWGDAAGVAAQARALSARLVPLATADAEAFARVVALRADPYADARDLGPALDHAAELPLAIADAGAATAELAALAAGWATGYEKADAIAAAALAEGATRAAAALVHANLTTMPGAARATRADELVQAAATARASAVEGGA